MSVTAYSLPQLPPMRCDRGCGKCCGIVPVGADEYERIAKVIGRRGIKPVAQGVTCPLYIDGQCSIYEARPLLCRIYGHDDHPACTCPRGYNANAKPAVVAKWRTALARNSRGGSRLLHELVYTPNEIGEILRAEVGA